MRPAKQRRCHRKDGIKEEVYEVKRVNGQETDRKLISSKVLENP